MNYRVAILDRVDFEELFVEKCRRLFGEEYHTYHVKNIYGEYLVCTSSKVEIEGFNPETLVLLDKAFSEREIIGEYNVANEVDDDNVESAIPFGLNNLRVLYKDDNTFDIILSPVVHFSWLINVKDIQNSSLSEITEFYNYCNFEFDEKYNMYVDPNEFYVFSCDKDYNKEDQFTREFLHIVLKEIVTSPDKKVNQEILDFYYLTISYEDNHMEIKDEFENKYVIYPS